MFGLAANLFLLGKHSNEKKKTMENFFEKHEQFVIKSAILLPQMNCGTIGHCEL